MTHPRSNWWTESKFCEYVACLGLNQNPFALFNLDDDHRVRSKTVMVFRVKL
jgi:hypothetical protein